MMLVVIPVAPKGQFQAARGKEDVSVQLQAAVRDSREEDSAA